MLLLHLPLLIDSFSPSLHLPFLHLFFSPSLHHPVLHLFISSSPCPPSLHLFISPSSISSSPHLPVLHLFISSSHLLSTLSLLLSMEDANFDRSVANQAVTYLHNEEEWARLVLADDAAGENIHHLIISHLLTFTIRDSFDCVSDHWLITFSSLLRIITHSNNSLSSLLHTFDFFIHLHLSQYSHLFLTIISTPYRDLERGSLQFHGPRFRQRNVSAYTTFPLLCLYHVIEIVCPFFIIINIQKCLRAHFHIHIHSHIHFLTCIFIDVGIIWSKWPSTISKACVTGTASIGTCLSVLTPLHVVPSTALTVLQCDDAM